MWVGVVGVDEPVVPLLACCEFCRTAPKVKVSLSVLLSPSTCLISNSARLLAKPLTPLIFVSVTLHCLK